MLTALERRLTLAGPDDLAAIEAEGYGAFMPHRSIGDLIGDAADRFGDAPALLYSPSGDPADPVEVTSFADYAAAVRQCANLFRGLGLSQDEAVAILAPNVPEAQFALWGAELAGRACPINLLLRPDHIRHLIQAADAEILVVWGPDPALPVWDSVQPVLDALEQPLIVLTIGPGADGVPSLATQRRAQQPELGFPLACTADTVAALYHTGGTTGAPKLVQHTHGNQLHTAVSAGWFYDLQPGEVMLNGFPLFHVAGAFVYGAACLHRGATQLLAPPRGLRDPLFMGHYWHHVARHRVNLLAGVPTIVAALLKTPPPPGLDTHSVRVMLTGGAPLPTELANQFEQHYGWPVRNIFGMTESAGLVTVEPVLGPRVPGSAGLRLPFTEVAVVPQGAGADAGRGLAPLPAGATGMVAVRGPHVSPGYLDPRHNAGTFMPEGWLLSGDLGHLDRDGRLHLTSRAKDVIIRSAHNIDPAVIEELAVTHPSVELAAAVGMPDAYAGEVPVLFVTARAGQTPEPDTLLAWLEPRIAEPPAMPRAVVVIDAMPVTAIGKVYKPELRRRATRMALEPLLADAPPHQLEVHEQAGVVHAAVTFHEGPPPTAVRRALGLLPVPVAVTPG